MPDAPGDPATGSGVLPGLVPPVPRIRCRVVVGHRLVRRRLGLLEDGDGFRGLDLDIVDFQKQVESRGLPASRRLWDSAKLRLGRFTLVTSEYRAGPFNGVIGVIGPTRMPYEKVIAMVSHTSRLLTELLD